MIKRVFKSLLCIYLIQLIIISCEDDNCNCSGTQKLEKIYDGIELRVFDTSGFEIAEIEESVHINSFGLVIFSEFEHEPITAKYKSTNFSSLGFNTAYACSCVPNEVITNDPIDSIEITAIDTENQEEAIVTDNFTFVGDDMVSRTINETLDSGGKVYDELLLNLVVHENIPENSVFKVEMTLASGTSFTELTEPIHFIE
ncbi:hypothetical protein B0O79_2918 [Flavobacteriaceae bacterium MAR_2009_75]|nr:hypothetical protein B0O79_2918 [Flavobacteriaceae bacterium MAR_2009_75]